LRGNTGQHLRRGGGIVFIPAILFLFHLPLVTALKIALASQSFGMTSGAVGWIQKRVVRLRALKLTVPGLLIGSATSFLVIHPSARLAPYLSRRSNPLVLKDDFRGHRDL
jgi:uncharacterized membrane protein YfcA